jgi:hypothetical protein
MSMIALAGAANGSVAQCTTLPGQANSCIALPKNVSIFLIVFVVISIVVFVFSLICEIKIITKAGYSGWYVLTAFVPLVNIAMFLVFAFGKWPIQARLEAAERGVFRSYPPPQFAPGMPGPTPAKGGVQPSAPSPTTETNLPPDTKTVIYCSWCGKERAMDAHAIHYCGTKDRPALFCRNCGTPFQAAASNCASCGTPVTELSS